jgi:hypothetical protein
MGEEIILTRDIPDCFIEMHNLKEYCEVEFIIDVEFDRVDGICAVDHIVYPHPSTGELVRFEPDCGSCILEHCVCHPDTLKYDAEATAESKLKSSWEDQIESGRETARGY